MAHMHADGSEEPGPRPDEEVAAIMHEMRLAAQSNLRNGQDRRQCIPFYIGVNYVAPDMVVRRCRRSGEDQRAVMSTFERAFFQTMH